jgi:hypothetical protein
MAIFLVGMRLVLSLVVYIKKPQRLMGLNPGPGEERWPTEVVPSLMVSPLKGRPSQWFLLLRA